MRDCNWNLRSQLEWNFQTVYRLPHSLTIARWPVSPILLNPSCSFRVTTQIPRAKEMRCMIKESELEATDTGDSGRRYSSSSEDWYKHRLWIRRVPPDEYLHHQELEQLSVIADLQQNSGACPLAVMLIGKFQASPTLHIVMTGNMIPRSCSSANLTWTEGMRLDVYRADEMW